MIRSLLAYWRGLLVLLAFLLFASPAWAQTSTSGDLVGDTVDETPVDNDKPITSLDILEENFRFTEPNAFIEFQVVNGPAEDLGERGTVFRDVNAQIQIQNDRIIVTDEPSDTTREPSSSPDNQIEFLTDEGLEELSGDLQVVNSFGIECGNDRNRDRNRDRFRDRFRDNDPFFRNPDFVDEDNDNIPDIFVEDIDDEDGDEDDDGDVDQDDELADAENDLNGEETTDGDAFSDDLGDDDGVSATADENGAEASTPGAVASAGGDPDELAPETSVPDDVVDDVVTSGPLPNTGGVPVAAGAVLAIVLFGTGLLAVRLVMLWRERRA